MKTFKEFLTEEEVLDGVKYIKEKCAPFFRASESNGVLWRGITKLKGEGKEMQFGNDAVQTYTMPVRKDRVPLTMPEELHTILDTWFDQKFGFKARSQSVFCYGAKGRNDAGGYGSNLSMVFPVGNFNLAWSPKVKDLYQEIGIDGNPGSKYGDHKTLPKEHFEEYVFEWMDKKRYEDSNLAEAVTTRCEIMIDCDSFIAIPGTLNQSNAVMKALGIK